MTTIWKTWSWETIIEQVRQQNEESVKKLLENGGEASNQLKLFEIMLNPRIQVHEPIWTVLTSNKNILKLLYDMFPTNKYILKTCNEITEDLKTTGYVKKPYSGRCGKNVTLFNDTGNVLDASAGNFEGIGSVYQ